MTFTKCALHFTKYFTFLANFNAFFPKSIENKIASWTHLPVSHGEVMYLLRYQLGQEYKPHFDYFDPAQTKNLGEAGNRVATVVMYLSDVEEGGETYFPDADGGQKAIPAKKGDAVLFWGFTVGMYQRGLAMANLHVSFVQMANQIPCLYTVENQSPKEQSGVLLGMSASEKPFPLVPVLIAVCRWIRAKPFWVQS